MRRVRYQVAASLDGFIAGPGGEFDWIPADADVDADLVDQFAQFDTFLMGRRTWEILPPETPIEGTIVVFSRTLRPEDHPGVTITSEPPADVVRALRARPGKDIWLFGGGELFRGLLDAGEVDTVEVAVVPILLGAGVPLLPGPHGRHPLVLERHRIYPKSGIALLEYRVARA